MTNIDGIHLGIKYNSTIYIIPVNTILYCKSEGNYTHFFLRDKKIMVYQPLSKTITFLPKNHFCRCHNSFIVNLNEIAEFNLKKSNIVLKNSIVIPVSFRRKKSILTAIKENGIENL